jgi:hypothetical protein
MVPTVKTLRSYRQQTIDATPKLCCCHVPKCAGTALWSAVAKQTPTAWQRLMMNRFVLNLRACQVASELEGVDYPQLASALASYHLADPKHAFVKGHFHCPPGMVARFSPSWGFLTILREPVDRFISAFVYDTYKDSQVFRNDLDIEAFLESQRGYYEGKIYLYHFSDYFRDPVRDDARVAAAKAEALDTLARFRLVGVVEEMDAWLQRFHAIFGRRLVVPKVNRSPKPEMAQKIRSDPGLMRRIEALCETDLEIYEKVRTGRLG